MSASESAGQAPGGIVAWFASNPVAANLLMVLIVAAGLFSLPGIRQEVFPEFSANVVTASVVYPGAAPEEVEESICVRIEQEVYAIEGVKRILSTAAEGAGAVALEVAPGYDVRRVLDDVKAAVDGIDTFPEEAERPVVSEVTLRKQVLYVAISGEAPERVLHRLGEEVRDDLAGLDDVGQAELYGVRPYEVSIEVGEADLQRHGLTFVEIADAVRRSALDVPGGGIKTSGGEVLLRARGRAYRGEEFERLPLVTRADGTRVELGDVARVVDGYADTDRSVRFDGNPAVLVAVFRTGDQSALGVGSAVQRYVAEAAERLPEGVELTIWRDDSRFLRERLDTLLANARSGLLLVFLVLALFLRLRLAFWVTLGIPISFLGTLAVMPLLGASINMLSLFAFILVLGIVVDDAIVVGESVYNKQSEGVRGLRGSIEGAREVAVPVTFAVLTTVVAFLPMLGLEGLTGRIWRIIPAVVIPALLFSLVESKLILPAHLAHGDGGSDSQTPRRAWLGLWDRVQVRFANGLLWLARSVYRPSLEVLLRWRWTTAASALAIFSSTIGLVVGERVKLTFFPPVEGDNVVALLTMPRGTPVDVTARAVARIEAAADELVRELEDQLDEGRPSVVQHMLTSVGEQPYLTEQSRNGGRTGQSFEGEHLGEVNLQLASSEVRDVTAAEVARRWRERVGGVPDAVELVFTSSLFSAGKPIDLQLSGRDLDALTAASRRLQERLTDYPGVYDIADSFRAGKAELTLRIKPGAEALGLSLSDLGRQVRAAFWGEEAQRFQRGRDEVKVMVRFPADERRSLADLEEMRIRTPN
ncbi:MAG TPA: efflux RND transporter permease subunit, partial [Planctomycetota bacterium]|nr:efflux RND transporter permease subunit [Planctomycetota bacterium]